MKIEALIAGYTAGSLGIFVGHPLDSLKVLAQTGGNSFCSISFIRSIIQSTLGNAKTNQPNLQDLLNKPNLISNRLLAVAASLSNNAKVPNSFLSLYAGIQGPLLTQGMITSVSFFMYDNIRRTLYHRSIALNSVTQENSSGNKKDYLYFDTLQNVFISACLSGGMMSVVTSPIIAIKTKQQVMQWSMKEAALDTLHTKVGSD